MLKYLKTKGYTKVESNSMYILAEGEIPVCLCAHMDTVFTKPPTEFYFDSEQSVLWSPDGLGADDRAGIFVIIALLEKGYRPSIILTDLEERGGIGADTLIKKHPTCPFKECKALIQLDREGRDDCVFYECDNDKFTDLIQSYDFYLNWGTFTDISIIAPAWGIAAVNLSVGYYYQHCEVEILKMAETYETIAKLERMLIDCGSWDKYKYIPLKYQKKGFHYNVWSKYGHCIYCGQPLPAPGCYCEECEKMIESESFK